MSATCSTCGAPISWAITQAGKASRAIRYARHELDAAPERDTDAERADPRLLDLAHEIGHARTHLALAARKAAEIMSARRGEGGER